MRKHHSARIAAILAVTAMLLLLAGCGKAAKTYTPVEMTSLTEYAKSLEAAGNPEAAAAVLATIPAHQANMTETIHSETPVASAVDELHQLQSVLNHVGGAAK